MQKNSQGFIPGAGTRMWLKLTRPSRHGSEQILDNSVHVTRENLADVVPTLLAMVGGGA